jgi:hypothetical protein
VSNRGGASGVKLRENLDMCKNLALQSGKIVDGLAHATG